jgi:hypothetical protein
MGSLNFCPNNAMVTFRLHSHNKSIMKIGGQGGGRNLTFRCLIRFQFLTNKLSFFSLIMIWMVNYDQNHRISQLVSWVSWEGL